MSESWALARPNPHFWQRRKVFLSGHTGFKGGWLALWLQEMGANVTGYGLPPCTTPALFDAAGVAQGMNSMIGDVRDAAAVRAALAASQAEVVLHLAAQPLVRASYDDPLGTYATNVMGSLHVLDAVRQVPSVKVVQVITSDKCYAPEEQRGAAGPGFRETDCLGGHDPYSNSKACVELLVDSYRRSFLAPKGVHVATARAGNVIGGGDWAADRIVPDAIRALWAGVPIPVRSPAAVRPWQHVLEPLSAYLVLAERQYEEQYQGTGQRACAFNFGPCAPETLTVAQLVAQLVAHWGAGSSTAQQTDSHKQELKFLKLNSEKAFNLLRWKSVWSVSDAVFHTVDWYKRVCIQGQDARQICAMQIAAYQQSFPQATPQEAATPLGQAI